MKKPKRVLYWDPPDRDILDIIEEEEREAPPYIDRYQFRKRD